MKRRGWAGNGGRRRRPDPLGLRIASRRGPPRTVHGQKITDDAGQRPRRGAVRRVGGQPSRPASRPRCLSPTSSGAPSGSCSTRRLEAVRPVEGRHPRQDRGGRDLRPVQPAIAALPAKPRAVLGEAFQDWARGRAGLVAVASQASGETPSPSNLEQLMNAGLAARDKWQKTTTSRPIPATRPTRAASPPPATARSPRPPRRSPRAAWRPRSTPTWVAALPDAQKCG